MKKGRKYIDPYFSSHGETFLVEVDLERERMKIIEQHGDILPDIRGEYLLTLEGFRNTLEELIESEIADILEKRGGGEK